MCMAPLRDCLSCAVCRVGTVRRSLLHYAQHAAAVLLVFYWCLGVFESHLNTTTRFRLLFYPPSFARRVSSIYISFRWRCESPPLTRCLGGQH